jgi:hypothetical protein
MNYSSLREGNIVRYVGKLHEYQSFRGRVVSINQDDTFTLAIKRYPKDEEHLICAYPYEIAPVVIDINKLTSLGFTLNKKNRVITRGDINIINMGYLKPDKDMYGNPCTTLDIKGFRLLTGRISEDRKEDEVMANSVDVNSFHALQNYYSINFREELHLV